MKEIGGYFEIEFANTALGLHSAATLLNSGRNGLEYILLARNIDRIYLPYYTCEAVLEPIERQGRAYSFYRIDKNLEPVDLPVFADNEALLYTNYFGLKNDFVDRLAGQQLANLIIDNSQALFHRPPAGCDVFYSLRKFVGVPDGGLLYCQAHAAVALPAADSTERTRHLYKRKNTTAGKGYPFFQESEQSLSGLPLQAMSGSTRSFLKTYDFEKNRLQRERNFLFLHSLIGHWNELAVDINSLSGPLCYPFYSRIPHLRERLLRQSVFVPTFWPNVRAWTGPSLEQDLVDNLLPLPIDQRYNLEDMRFIATTIDACSRHHDVEPTMQP